ncbi:dihydrofolate reductase [Aurantibacillus circumpalustris]|uniref:dihydrofolate reductase n=1 Tax=Aurantibacillus circumpalustris TaxID=3036359 RepID=UPI00295C2D7A|nr:dihydrofolate reductase [Aurantibacillus circumpalustris]
MLLAAIVVTDLNNAIGINNQLLCHLPADLKFFKATTMGCPIIMGRKTYESIGRLLPGRKNIVITRSSDYKIEGAEIYHSVEAAIKSCTEEKVFIIGGAEIFKQTLPQITEVFRTSIQHSFEADAWFPELKNSDFKMVWEECHAADEKNKFDYCFQKWERFR